MRYPLDKIKRGKQVPLLFFTPKINLSADEAAAEVLENILHPVKQ